MKIKITEFLIFVFVFCFNLEIKADTIFFDSKNIQIENQGNMIYSLKGIAKIPDQKIIVEGDRSKYNKLISQLVVVGNVKFFDNLNDVYIESEKAIYNEIDNTILTQGKTFIKVENKYEVFSKDVLYDRNLMEVLSESDTKVYDDINNIYNFKDGFLLDTIKEVISSKRTNIIDSQNNSYLFEKAKVNLKTRELVGKEVRVDFIDDFFGNKNNDPLLVGKSTTSNDNNTTIYKAVFSTCNIENKKCRGWELQSEEFIHNKIERLFQYKNSWLKVFGQRVFFFPYFSHPDPSVKRKSGFLTPVYSSSDNLGRAINIPYFLALSNAKDMTLNPRLYSDGDFILQSEYRESFKNSELITDFSFNQDEGNTNTHFYLNSVGKLNSNTAYELEIQNVTNDNYLKIHDFAGIADTNALVSKFNPSSLRSFIEIDKSLDEDTRLKTSVRMYEKLTVSKGSDKYQYVFPNFSFSKNIDIDESYNGQFSFGSGGYQKNYDTNIYEAQLNNDFNYSSYNYFTDGGILTNYRLLLKNTNKYSENPSTLDENSEHDLLGSFLINSELPLKKKLSNETTNFLKPKVQFKFTPTNGSDISSNSSRLSYGNIFSSSRIGTGDTAEVGRSLTIGIEYEKQNFFKEKILGFDLGNVIKDKKNISMPKKAKLDQTRSDIVGKFFYKPNDLLQLGYDFSLDRDLKYSNYDAISAKIGANKFVTNFSYFTENHELGNSETISNETNINFTDEHSLKFNTTKDLLTDFTQFYKLSYEYETDCLLATFQYQKKFFRDGNLVPDQSLFFLVRFIPFTELRGSANTLINNR